MAKFFCMTLSKRYGLIVCFRIPVPWGVKSNRSTRVCSPSTDEGYLSSSEVVAYVALMTSVIYAAIKLFSLNYFNEFANPVAVTFDEAFSFLLVELLPGIYRAFFFAKLSELVYLAGIIALLLPLIYLACVSFRKEISPLLRAPMAVLSLGSLSTIFYALGGFVARDRIKFGFKDTPVYCEVLNHDESKDLFCGVGIFQGAEKVYVYNENKQQTRVFEYSQVVKSWVE